MVAPVRPGLFAHVVRETKKAARLTQCSVPVAAFFCVAGTRTANTRVVNSKDGPVMDTRSDTIVRTLSGERFTPFAVARKLNARVLLESATFQNGRERYSLVMVDEAFRVFETGDGIFLSDDRGRWRVKSRARDILDVLRYIADQHEPMQGGIPFPAGGVGYLSYEFSAKCDTIRLSDRPDPLGLPLASFMFGHVFIVFDHYTDELHLIGVNYREHEVDLQTVVDDVAERILDDDYGHMSLDDGHYHAEVGKNPQEKERFKDGVAVLKDEIVAGNLLQAVLSRRVEAVTELPALEAYRRLRTANPAPYLFFLDYGESQLFGASPEVHVKVRGGEVQIRPIAGTRRRGATDAEDRALEAELLADEKELAEHRMLVDLARNDIGRVCSEVHLTDLLTIERYSRVMHIVSEARGTLRQGADGIHALRATFPAGTVSGAPKIRAIETLDAIEPHRRGFYAGVVGYIEPGGNLDTCIAIRCAMKTGNTMVLQAGAGVVYDSTPEREYEETQEKLSALARAIGLEV